MRNKLLIFVFLGLLVAGFVYQKTEKTPVPRAFLGGEALVLEIADTDALHTRGLSGHKPLAENEGMLFVFPKDGLYGFWMKDMLFPLDILWLDSEYRIIDVREGATPESYPQIFTPSTPARYVLELSSGFFSKHKLKNGNILEIMK